ncbi:MAG: glutamine--tRNA ligase/YqeY domain fusion protein [Victivallales bacterium]|nr:glutamine--tRNA ligase/YqeY domain fusion protein [Victivallales bacterium]
MSDKNEIEGCVVGQAGDFIRDIVAAEAAAGKVVRTRFPPEPNGYLHIGHAKAICIDFGIAEEFGGSCNLRMDDTNPSKESMDYVEGIKRDIAWLGFKWDKLCFASDYFEQMYDYAVKLVGMGLAYVCELSSEDVRVSRGTLTEAGRGSPFRDRPVQENLELFKRMRGGEFPDGSMTLRAKIDMASPNLNLRDPVMYRILRVGHYRAKDKWCIYPSYDWAHGLEDSIEGITFSLCDLDFENHRPLYDWFLDKLEIHHPRQIEFARLNLSHTVMSKRKLMTLVEKRLVSGWDDPRMPTICGLRRRGFSPGAIRRFCSTIGVTKFNSLTDCALLDHCLREDLNKTATRAMAIIDPVKVVIENYPEGSTEMLEAVNNPEDPAAGTRKIPFSRELYIESGDFMDSPPPKFFRLSPGREVRLRYAYFIKCLRAVRDDSGNLVELRCSYDPETRGGNAADGRKVKGTIHWVSAAHSAVGEVRLYDRLFLEEKPDSEDYERLVNPESEKILLGCRLEPSLPQAKPGAVFQFERLGYFCADLKTHSPEKPVFNRTVPLRESWAKNRK